MAATQPAVYVENALRVEKIAPPRRYTDVDTESLASIRLPQHTDASSNTVTSSTTFGQPEAPMPVPNLLPATMGRRSVDAVIDEITQDSVIIRCLLPAGYTVDLRLPPSIIPSRLLQYGQPVSVSLDTASGVRAPRIEARTITPSPNDFWDQKTLDEWLDSI
jgi:hypothetical protein